MQMDSLLSLYWVLAIILFSYSGIDLFITKSLVRKHAHPLVGSPSIIAPRVTLNLIFAGKAAQILEDGYRKFKSRAFQLIRGDGSVVVLPVSLLDELSTLPPSVASPNAALEHDLLGPYTGLDLMLESRLHHSIVQRKLTPRLALLTPGLEDELKNAFKDYFPACNEWTEFMPYQLFGRISARLSGRALVGNTFCRDPTWLDISFNYTENVFRTIVILRLFPSWVHPLLCRILPSFWHGQRYVRLAKSLLAPKIRSLLRRNDDNSWIPADNEEDSNVLSWLIETAKGKDRDPDTLAHVEVLLALASVHTTLLRMVNVLYDLVAQPDYLKELQTEIETEAESGQGWNEASYSQLHKLDSVLRESQRMSPPSILGMKRLFKQPYTFSDGLHVPAGTYACLPTFAIENDPEHSPHPETFDGLRSYRRRQQMYVMESKVKSTEEHLFSSPGRTSLNFGFGKSACPGRFFASLIIKMLFVKLLTEHDFQFLPGTTKRPKNILVHEFLFCWPWQKMLVRRKDNVTCPL